MNINTFNNPSEPVPFLIDLQLFSSEGDVSSNDSTAQLGDTTSSQSSNIVDTYEATLKIFEESGQAESSGTEQVMQTSQQPLQDPVKDNLVQNNDVIPSANSELPWYQEKGFKTEEEAIKSFDHLRDAYTKTSQELAQIKNNNANNQQQQQVKQQEEPQPQISEFNPEQFEEEFYNDMSGTITKLIENIVSKKLNPVVQKVNPVIEKFEYAEEKQAMNNLVNDFYSKHEDMMEYKQDMTDFLNQYSDLPKNAKTLEVAYNYAKGLKSNNVNPAQLLNDPNVILQNLTNNQALLNQVISNPAIIQAIMKNEGSRNSIVSNHIMEVKKNNGNIPTVIGNHNGSMTTITPPRKATSWEDASKMAIEIFNMNG